MKYKKSEGWNQHKELTENNEKLLQIDEDDETSLEMILKGIEKELRKIIYKCFWKSKLSHKTPADKRLENLQ